MKLIKGNKTLSFSLPYMGDIALDIKKAKDKLNEARQFIEGLSEDPYLVRPVNYGSSLEENLRPLPSEDEMINSVLNLAGEVDLAGLFSL
jgi:hypothetical protein